MLKLKLKVQKAQPLYQQVYSLLREAIEKGAVAPGQRLVETAVAEQLEVSRTPVRDALRKLENEHLIVALPGGGYEAHRPSPQEVGDLYDLRAALEGLASRLAANHASARDLQAMDETIQAMREAYGRSDLNAVIQLNTRFHDLLVTASGNSYVQEVMNLLRPRILQLRNFVRELHEDPRLVLKAHEGILNALQSRNEVQAESLMPTHILTNRQTALERYQRQTRECGLG
ncbi:MAG: GntR family transcriptional regulator [Firmicutes bacterium]|nr:GntR family transcriptional regulator [Bacillota bacterium]